MNTCSFRFFWLVLQERQLLLASQNFLSVRMCLKPVSSTFWGLVSWKAIFPSSGNRSGFRMIQVHYIYCALYFYYYYISSTADHQALDLGGGGPCQVIEWKKVYKLESDVNLHLFMMLKWTPEEPDFDGGTLLLWDFGLRCHRSVSS